MCAIVCAQLYTKKTLKKSGETLFEAVLDLGHARGTGSAGMGMQTDQLSRSSKVRAMTLVARRTSSSCTRSSARLAWLSSTVRGPAP